MIKKRQCLTLYSYLSSKPPKRPLSSLPLSSALPLDHQSNAFHLFEGVIDRCRLVSAQNAIQRMIVSSSSLSDAIEVVDSVRLRGLELNCGICSALIRKLVESGEFSLAREFFNDDVVRKGVVPDSNLLTSMVICLAKLGEFDEAVSMYDKLAPGKVACKALVRGFLDKDRILDAVDWLVSTSNVYDHVPLDMCSYTVLITGLCEKGYMEEAIKVFDIMRDRSGLVPTLRLLKSLFYGLCDGGKPSVAETFLGQMEKLGFYIDKVMYTSLMNAYQKDKKMKMAMRVFYRMLKRGCQPDIHSYNTLIHGFAEMDMFDKVRVLFNQVNQLGMKPNVVTYNIMFSSYCRQGEMDCAERLWDAMIRDNLCPTVHCYTYLFAFFYKENKFDEVKELLEKMLNSEVVPDHVLFFTLIKDSRKGHELRLALWMLCEIAKHGCGLDSSTLPFSSNPALDAEHEIEVLLEKISRSDLNLANVAVGIYITALCEAGKTNAAVECLGKLVNADRSLSLFIINSLIRRLLQDGLFKDPKSLFDAILEWGVVPNLATYNIMVNGYCQRGELDVVADICRDMVKKGLKPDISIYNSIMSCLSRENRLLEASQWFDMMKKQAIKPNFYCCTALITGLVKKGMINKGCSYISEMLRDGFVPNVVFYTSLIKHFLRRGKLDFVFRLVGLMDSNGIERDQTFYVVMATGICRNISLIKQPLHEEDQNLKGQKEMLLRVLNQRPMFSSENNLRASLSTPETARYYLSTLLQELEGTGFMPNLYLYNVIISSYTWANMMGDAYDQFERMQKQGVRPNEVTFTILMDAHGRAGQIDDAVSLFNRMNEYGCSPDSTACNTLLKGMCRARRGLDALSLVYAMRKRGVFPDKVAYGSLIDCLCDCSLSIPAFRVFEEMIALGYVPREYFIRPLLMILSDENRYDEVDKVIDMLCERGKSPSHHTLKLAGLA